MYIRTATLPKPQILVSNILIEKKIKTMDSIAEVHRKLLVNWYNYENVYASMTTMMTETFYFMRKKSKKEPNELNLS